MSIVVEKCVTRREVLGRTRITWDASGVITEMAATSASPEAHMALPGLIDSHFHGFGGVDTAFAAPSPEEWSRLDDGLLARGVTSYVPGICTGSPDVISGIVEDIGRAQAEGLLGLFLEGPFTSPEALGGLPAEQIRGADPGLCGEMLAAGQGLVRIVLVSPEIAGACELIAFLRENGAIAAIGHSRAGYDEAVRAIDAGATRAVHWPNVMKWGDHHDPAIGVAVLNDDRVYVEVIGDDQHVAGPMVELVARCKGDKMVMISDSVAVAGAADDPAVVAACGLEMRDGRLFKAGTDIHSGSYHSLDECYGIQLAMKKLPAAYIAAACSAHAAESLGVNDRGDIAVGKRADLFIVDESGRTLQVCRSGRPAIGA